MLALACLLYCYHCAFRITARLLAAAPQCKSRTSVVVMPPRWTGQVKLTLVAAEDHSDGMVLSVTDLLIRTPTLLGHGTRYRHVVTSI